MTFLSKTTGVKGLTLIGNRNKLWTVILQISSAKCTSWNLSNGYLSSKSTNSLNHISRYSTNRSSHRRRSVRKGVLRNFVKFIGKHLCQSLYFNKVACLTLLKYRLWHKYFPVTFPKFRGRHRRCSVKKGALRNFAKFTGKHLCQGLLFNKVAGLGLQLY